MTPMPTNNEPKLVVTEADRKVAERAGEFILLNGVSYAGFKAELYRFGRRGEVGEV